MAARTGKQFLQGLRDGRELWVGGDKIGSIADHPALRGAAGALDPMLQHVTDLACEMLDCERASLRMLDDSRSRLLVAARTGTSVPHAMTVG